MLPELPLPELQELATYRLDRGLTFRRLAAEMAAAGFPVPMRTLHTAIRNKNFHHEIGLHRIRRFLAHQREASRLPQGRARTVRDQEPKTTSRSSGAAR